MDRCREEITFLIWARIEHFWGRSEAKVIREEYREQEQPVLASVEEKKVGMNMNGMTEKDKGEIQSSLPTEREQYSRRFCAGHRLWRHKNRYCQC